MRCSICDSVFVFRDSAMILLDGSISLADLLAIADDRAEVGLAPDARARVAAARAVVDAKAAGDAAVYGVNTGFGNFAETRIDKHDLAALQLNLLRSHAAGVDAPLPVRAVRAAMALRANVLAKGFSGIRVETLEALLALLNRGVHPRVPSRGSVGASGDLAPLAHLALVLVGEGETLRSGRPLSDGRAWRRSAAASRPRAGHARSRRKASRSSTARRSPPRSSRWPWPAPSG